MISLEHVALWTKHLTREKEYYEKYFDATAGEKYFNPATGLESYFMTFGSGARLELMQKPDVPENLNDRRDKQHQGIIHLAFGVESMPEVDAKAAKLKTAGYEVLRGPRKTGDGYYEFETLDPDGNRLEVCAVWDPSNA